MTGMPRLPRALALAARPLPLTPLSLALTALTRRMTARHPGILRRLGPHARARVLMDVTDAPVLLLLQPDVGRLTAHRRSRPPAHDARITGLLAAFLAMLHGAADGDALFFSGDLAIEGDTGAVLALRNALDDAELDLGAELAAIGGRAAAPLARLAGVAERWTGYRLRRAAGEGRAW